MGMCEPTKEQVEAWIKANDFDRVKIENNLGLTTHELTNLAWDMGLTKIPFNPFKSDNPKDWCWLNKYQVEAMQTKKREK